MREVYTKDFIQNIVDLYNNGKSVIDLSLEYGVKNVAISNLINQKKAVVTIDDEEIFRSVIIALKKRIYGQ